ncbi:MAG: tail fiber domain-containing protein [Chloroflexia bacterium]|nr:tail fiber domain-containing protein [Chloroflexia bacterium]
MVSNTEAGIYDDVNNKWMINGTKNAQVQLYYNGGVKITTTNTGVNVTGKIAATGAPNGSGQIEWQGATGQTGYTYSDISGVGITNADPYQELIYLYNDLHRILFQTSGETRGYFSSTGLNVVGNMTASGEVTAYSDKRLKFDIESLDNANSLDKVMKLNPVSYTKDNKKGIGLIAQEVKKIIPELVHGEETEDSYLSMNYAQLTAVLVSALQNAIGRIEVLENKNIFIRISKYLKIGINKIKTRWENH